MNDTASDGPEEEEMGVSCVAMTLMISTSGGYSGIGAAQDTAVELDLLPEVQRVQVDRLLEETETTQPELTTERVPDELVYEFELWNCGEKIRSFRLRESTMAPERLDLLDELIHGSK